MKRAWHDAFGEAYKAKVAGNERDRRNAVKRMVEADRALGIKLTGDHVGTVKVNFADVEDFDAVPEGEYSAEITKIEYREAKDKGKAPYLNVEYTITDPEEFLGRKVWEVLSWAPKALFRMRDFFRAAGFEDDEYDLEIDEETNLLTSPDLIEEAVTITVENEIYNKKETNRIKSTEFDSPPGLEEEDVEEEDDSESDDEEEEVEDDDTEDEEEDEDEEVEVEDDDEEEEEEEPVKPARRSTSKATPAKAPVKATAKAAPAKATPATSKVSPIKKTAAAPARATSAKKTPATAKKRTFR